MKTFGILAFVLLAAAGAVAADDAESTLGDSSAVRAQNPAYFNLVVGPDMPMNPGMENVITVDYLAGLAIDRAVGRKWFAEEKTVGKVGGVVGRILRYSLLDAPLGYFSVVYAHEYFGHGARYRELSVEPIDYGYDAPPPYGNGGGHASASITDPISNDELMTILIGGMETQAIINRKMNLRWMANEQVRYHEASLHHWSFRIMFDYIMDTENTLGVDNDGKDASEYLTLLNQKAGVADMSSPRMDVDYLKSRLWINMANPFGWYALYSIYKSFFWDGNVTTKMPMIRIGSLGYLPSLRMNLTPFGPEYHVENYFHTGTKVVLLDVRIGDRTFYNSWGGVNLALQNVLQQKRLSLDCDLSVWNQPGLTLVRNKQEQVGNGTGGALSVAMHYDLSDQANPLAAFLQVGYKTAGYMEGYDLDSAPMFMIGLGYRN